MPADPAGGLPDADADLRRLARATDPVEVCGLFTEYAGGAPPDEPQWRVLRAVVESAQHESAQQGEAA